MKKLLRSIFSLSLIATVATATAQLDGTTTVSNFTGIDLNGTSHTLYDYLDAGKIVYVDVSATWCGPCWNLHQTGILEDLYEAYGPNGTDEIMFLWVEGDPSTGLADLQGNTGSSQGDWITGTTYPIIDDDGTINDALDIAYFPTTYRIYPDRSIEETSMTGKTIEQIRAEEKEYELGTLSLDAKVFYKPFIEKIDCDGFLFPKVTMQNFGTTTLTSATVELISNGTVIDSRAWTGSLEQYATEVFNFGLVQLTDGTYELEIKISAPNGGTDDNEDNNSAIDYLVVNSSAIKPTLKIYPDQYSSEVEWRILDWNSSVVFQGSGYGNNSNISKSLCLNDNQCYTLEVYDTFGDGFSGGGNGGEITLNGSALMSFASSDHTGSFYSQEFCLGSPTGIEEVTSNLFEVYPNPVSNSTNVVYNVASTENVTIDIINVLGEKVYNQNIGSQSAGNYTHNFDGTNLKKGIYFLNLTVGSDTKSKKIVVK